MGFSSFLARMRSQSTGSAYRLSTGTWKKPWICGVWRSIVTTRSAPAASIASAQTRARIETRGSSLAPGAVSLPPESWVEGDVHARSVAVRGAVDGDLVAEDTVEVGPEASLDGGIMCRTLVA